MHKPVSMTRGKLLIISLSILVMFACSVAFSVYASNRAVTESQEAERRQAVVAITPVCRYLYSTSDVYKETPPSTPAGKKQQVAVESMIVTFECERYVHRG